MSRGSAPSGSDPEQSMLVSQVKAIQRESDRAKNAWHDFCETRGGGVRDPARHGAEYLRQFLEAYSSGSIPTALHHQKVPKEGEGDPEKVLDLLVAKIKHGQRSSQSYKERWWTYCDTHQAGVRDPGRHDVASLRTFMEEFAPRIGVGSGDSASSRGGAGHGRGESSGSGMPGGGISALAERVKAMQRRHERYKEQWVWCCDTYGNGVRDPARHSPQFLQQYIAMVESGNPQNSSKAQYQPYGGKGMAAPGWGGCPGYPGYPFGGYPGYGAAAGAWPSMMYPNFGYGAMPMFMFGAGGMLEGSSKRSKKKALKDAEPDSKRAPKREDAEDAEDAESASSDYSDDRSAQSSDL